MNILGLNAFHGDSSAALLMDGKLVAAVEEERFLRIKHWAGFPAESIRYCLAAGGLRLGDVDAIAVNQNPRASFFRKLGYVLINRPDPGLILDRIRNRRKRAGANTLLEKIFPGERFTGSIHYIEHHLAHLASSFHVSPFKDAVNVSVDGFGDFASAAWGAGHDNRIRIDGRIYFPHSLGIFYEALTQYLGFPFYGDEYKVMGLAPYGQPAFMEAMREVVHLQNDGGYRLNLDYFRHHKEQLDYEWENGQPVLGNLYSAKLETLLGPARHKDHELDQRHKDIACSVQAMYETAFFHLLNSLYPVYDTGNLTLSGGCAMNSVANGKIFRNTPFRKVYIPAAAGDAGGAIGAAFAAWHRMHDNSDHRFIMDHACWGSEYSNDQIQAVVDARKEDLKKITCRVEFIHDQNLLCQRTATTIAAGCVVGWFQGRMEWGPRALGNRSIVCDPRRPDMKELLNRKIKRRESFRPFAPSILREAVSEWFETEEDVPFMSQVFQIRTEQRHKIPAVTHVDGSGRLQTVTRESNARYYALIKAFREIAGIPLILNTSFNENEPIVCKPEEALECFLRTDMDVLVMNDYLLSRQRDTQ